MKRFLLKITTTSLPAPEDGSSITLYETILTFTPEQEKEYIDWILSKIESDGKSNDTWCGFFFADAIEEFMSEQKIDNKDDERVVSFKNLSWEKMAEEHPDLFIVVGTTARVNDEYCYKNFFEWESFSEVHDLPIEEEIVTNNLKNVSWECKRLPINFYGGG